jgi:hypothetical protein
VDIMVADHGRRRELRASYEAYGYDTETVDGVKRVPFGVQDKTTQAELLRGHHPDVDGDGYVRGPFAVTLTHRASELPPQQAAELIRAAYFHYFTNHFYCEWVGSLTITDVDGTEHTFPFDRC